jgi:hypothetical protein
MQEEEEIKQRGGTEAYKEAEGDVWHDGTNYNTLICGEK